jgi:hypothetical protein
MEDLAASTYTFFCEIILAADHPQLPSTVLRLMEGTATVIDEAPTSSSSSSSSSSA